MHAILIYHSLYFATELLLLHKPCIMHVTYQRNTYIVYITSIVKPYHIMY